MDYEKKYNEALQKAEAINSGKYVNIPTENTVLEYVFPELKESEDERIRKGLIEYFKWFCGNYPKTTKWGKDDGLFVKDIIAWLEKQHTDPYNGVSFDCYGHRWGMCARDNGIEIVMDGKPVRHFSYKDCEQTFGGKSAREAINEVKVDNQNRVKSADFKAEHFYVSKVDGQIHDMTYNPAEKVEPKFKVGEWCVDHNSKIAIIYDLQKAGYVGHYADGTDFVCKYSDEHLLHLWTIQDAKDGDVLQLGNVTAIFQEYIGNGNCKCHCSAYDGEFEIPSRDYEDNYGCIDATPATKEQSNLLFQKMKESGYEWDAEKKEVKEIENKRPLLSDFINAAYERGKADTQKLAWSKEDERLWHSCIAHIEDELEQIGNDKYGHSEIISDLEESCRERIKWLESVKQRIKRR